MPDELREIPAHQHLLNEALCAIMMFVAGDSADDGACDAFSEHLAEYSKGQLSEPRDEVLALLGAAFRRMARVEDALVGGRYYRSDPAEVMRRFADWIDENRDAQA